MNNPSSEPPGGGKKPTIVKKYANRRLYNTATSSYVTLEDLAGMIKQGGDFVAYDAKTGEDITRSVLTRSSSSRSKKGRICCRSVFCGNSSAFTATACSSWCPAIWSR